MYSRHRVSFKVYANEGLHRMVVIGLLSLLVDKHGLLYFAPAQCQESFHVLRAHFDHPANYTLRHQLHYQVRKWAPHARPLLRLLCSGIFDQNLYTTPRLVHELPFSSSFIWIIFSLSDCSLSGMHAP